MRNEVVYISSLRDLETGQIIMAYLVFSCFVVHVVQIFIFPKNIHVYIFIPSELYPFQVKEAYTKICMELMSY